MIKLFITLIIGMVTFSQSFAQFSYGIKGGLNLVNVGLEEFYGVLNNKFRPSFHFGVYGQYDLNEKFFLQPEFTFSNKGYTSKATDPLAEGKVILNYMSLPVLMGYSFNDKFAMHLGPEFSYLLSAKSKFDSQTRDIENTWGRKLDIGIALGLNYSLTKKIDLGVRYIYGLLNVIDVEVFITDGSGDPNLGGIENFKSQNRVFQLSVGYRLK